MNKFEFGDYCLIAQNRYSCLNEMFLHKVIGTFKSNTWMEVPFKVGSKEIIHKEIKTVVACITCGVSEDEVYRYLEKDCKKQENEKLKLIIECLKFYADTGNYFNHGYGDIFYDAGKQARELLKKLGIE